MRLEWRAVAWVWVACLLLAHGPFQAHATATPSATPSAAPTAAPTSAPTGTPTAAPTSAPTGAPTIAPTAPTAAPTSAPTAVPTRTPTEAPTASDGDAVHLSADPGVASGITIGANATGGDPDAPTTTIMNLAFTNASVGMMVVAAPLARTRAAIEAAGNASGCNASAYDNGRVVRGFTLDVIPDSDVNFTVRVALLPTNEAPFRGYYARRHVRLCYEGVWRSSDEVCALVHGVNATAADGAAPNTTVVRVADARTTVLIWTLCHATPYVLLDPETERPVCDPGAYGCDCSLDSYWIKDAAYLACLVVGSAVAMVAIVLHWAVMGRSSGGGSSSSRGGGSDGEADRMLDSAADSVVAALERAPSKGAFAWPQALLAVGLVLVLVSTQTLRPGGDDPSAAHSMRGAWGSWVGWGTLAFAVVTLPCATLLPTQFIMFAVAYTLWFCALVTWSTQLTYSTTLAVGSILAVVFLISCAETFAFVFNAAMRNWMRRHWKALAALHSVAFAATTVVLLIIAPCANDA